MQILSQVDILLSSSQGCSKIDNCTFIHDERYPGVSVPLAQNTPSSAPIPPRLPPYNPYANPSHYYNPPPSNSSTPSPTQPTITLPWATPLPTPPIVPLLRPTPPGTPPASLQGHLVLPPHSPTAMQDTHKRRATPQEGNLKAMEEAGRDKGTQVGADRVLQGRAIQEVSRKVSKDTP